MKNLNDIAIANFNKLVPSCDPEKVIKSIMHFGEQISLENPILAKEVICKMCGGNHGFFIPHRSTWSCLNPKCITENAKPPERKQFLENHTNDKKTAVSICNQPKEILDFMSKFAEKPSGFVVLSGKNGTGKTHLAKAVYDDFRCNPGERFLITQTDLFQKFIQHQEKFGSTWGLIELMLEYKLLILDDLGTRIPSEAFVDFLYAIADKRYTKKEEFGTIITTNLIGKDFRERFGDAFTSRVSYGKSFRFDSMDRRFNK